MMTRERETIARIIDPISWEMQDRMGARETQIYGFDTRPSLSKADDILLALGPGEGIRPDASIPLLRSALKAALAWIDALPRDVVAALPAMPGFDRDEVDGLIFDTAPSPIPNREGEEP